MVTFWDLPGVGTAKFPKDRYLHDISVDSYDCFVIITSKRFTETDTWLAGEISGRKKHFYFARSNIETDVRNDKRENEEDRNEKSVFDKIRSTSIDQLKALRMDQKVFLIDNYFPLKYNFSDLEHTIISDLSELKRHAMILTLAAPTGSMIKVKAEELRSRIPWVAMYSAASKLVSIPLLGIDIDVRCLTNEIEFYYERFDLGDDSLKRRAKVMSVSFDSLKQIVTRELPQASGLDLLGELATIGERTTAWQVSRFFSCFPLVGALVTAPISLSFTTFAMEYMLDRMEKASIEVANVCLAGN